MKKFIENQIQGSKVIILLGPTCVGKTGASILLAEHLDTDIISADSMQIYRHMDIGTAKPSIEERNRVIHHMIDIVDPDESYSCGQYIEHVVPVVRLLLKRGKTPVAVGGTGLYIRAMTHGIFSAPDSDWSLREELLLMEKEEKGSLYDYLKIIDPQAASNMQLSDIKRIVRALEVYIKSGKKISELQRESTKPLPFSFIKIGIKRDRSELYSMIDRRVDKMIENGLIEEVRNIMKLNPSHTTIQAIGYKEIVEYIKGNISLNTAIGHIKKATRRYAKRQFTWFKKEENIKWIDITGIFDASDIYKRIVVSCQGGICKFSCFVVF